MSSRRQQGSATLWMIFMSIAILAVAGLVIDGGYTLAAKREAARVAEQSARVGADQLDTDSLRTGGSDLVPSEARAAAHRYAAAAGLTAAVRVRGDEVTVVVTSRTKSVILGAFGVSGYTVHSEATAMSIDENNESQN
ncbi:hypothetical protein ASD11_14625 [Aeromicrobium sp. Root495]|uniref:Tad domain-containing protein n=1 Tax=Aeromicrobium sp. Root495 TaxID=1736550 RepID=UPI0007014111|nr:Tad domain-containing protein [Aeromicrobium sp. Root495]KQY55744.1 hypothetical protein ASD11_14625 [Aeromicrobium sp. Root495]